MITIFKKVSELIEKNEECPFPLSVIPNHMGINLSSVDAISWQKLSDGQLTSLTIHFSPIDGLIEREKESFAAGFKRGTHEATPHTAGDDAGKTE